LQVPLFHDSENGWTFCEKKLRESITSKTKVILINTPHNPTGIDLSL
jgi:aspartate/methionine/tyrosine aminotransferase